MTADHSFAVGMAAYQTLFTGPADLADGCFPTSTLHLLCEMASHNVLAPHFGPDDASVGLHNDIWYWGDALQGELVHAEAAITRISRRRLTFNVFVRASIREIARGTHERVLVSRARFLEGLEAHQ